MEIVKNLQTSTKSDEEIENFQIFLQNFRFPLAFSGKVWYNIRQMRLPCANAPQVNTEGMIP